MQWYSWPDLQLHAAASKVQLLCLVYFGRTVRNFYHFRIIFDLLREKFRPKTAFCDASDDFPQLLLGYHDCLYLYTWTFKPEKWRSACQVGKLAKHFRFTWRLFLHNSWLAFHWAVPFSQSTHTHRHKNVWKGCEQDYDEKGKIKKCDN